MENQKVLWQHTERELSPVLSNERILRKSDTYAKAGIRIQHHVKIMNKEEGRRFHADGKHVAKPKVGKRHRIFEEYREFPDNLRTNLRSDES